MKVYIIIPAYNEEKTIAQVVQMVRKYGWRNVIVVDDGSTDRTLSEAARARARVLRHCVNCGKGAAIKTGITMAKKYGADAVVTLDADMQHHGRDIKNLVSPLKRNYSVVLGSRFLSRNKIPLIKRASNLVANIITALFCGIWVSDSQCGMRAYGKNALEKLNFQGDRYEFESEILRSVRQTKMRFIEVPVRVRYTKYSMHKTTRQSFGSSIHTFIALLQRT